MDLMPVLYGGISLFLVYVMLEVWSQNKGSRRQSDFYQENFYFILFVMSVLWLMAGMLMRDHTMTGIGLIFVSGGLLNKSEWEGHNFGWGDLNEEARKTIIIMTEAMAISAVSGLLIFYLASKGII